MTAAEVFCKELEELLAKGKRGEILILSVNGLGRTFEEMGFKYNDYWSDNCNEYVRMKRGSIIVEFGSECGDGTVTFSIKAYLTLRDYERLICKHVFEIPVSIDLTGKAECGED